MVGYLVRGKAEMSDDAKADLSAVVKEVLKAEKLVVVRAVLMVERWEFY
jgi:hypothetical protein